MSIQGLMVNQVAIEASSATKDTSGGPRLRFEQVEGKEEVACSIHPAKAELQRDYSQRQLRVTHRIYFDQDHGILRNYRLLDTSGRYYIVHGGGNFAGRDRVWFIDCEEQA